MDICHKSAFKLTAQKMRALFKISNIPRVQSKLFSRTKIAIMSVSVIQPPKLSRSPSFDSDNSNKSFTLAGFESERLEVDQLIISKFQMKTINHQWFNYPTEYKNDIDNYVNSTGFNLEGMLACPMGVSYFYKYLSDEHNEENIMCYFELKSLLDYLLYARKKLNWFVDTSDILNQEDEFNSRSSFSSSSSSSSLSSTNKPFMSICNMEESKECIRRISQFQKQYFDAASIYEINVSSNTKKKVLESFIFNKGAYKGEKDLVDPNTEKKENEACTITLEQQMANVHHYIENVTHTLEELRSELSMNLMDPFNRFLTSDAMYECMALFMSSKGDDSFHRERLLGANKGEGVVLNQPSGADKTLVMLDKSIGSLSTVHPITRVTELLNTLISILNSSTDLYSVDISNTVGSTKNSEYGTTMQIDLNYDNVSNSSATTCYPFEKFKHETFELAHIDLSLLKSDEEKIAFFVNAYNLLLLHAIIMSGSLPQIEVTNIIFYRKTKYNIGGHLFSLQDMFNGILQCNQMKSLLYGKAFKKNDPRREFIPQKTFPEVYLGLLNMSKYSPKLRVYEPTTVVQQLKDNSKDYFSRYVQVLFSSDEKVLDLIEVALPNNLREHRAELKNFWKDENLAVIKSTSHSGLSSISPDQSSTMSRSSSDSFNTSFMSSESVKAAEKRRNVLEYLIESYHPEMVTKSGEFRTISSHTKYTYKSYTSNPPNWFAVFEDNFQKNITERYKVDEPAAGEILLPKKAKENNCPIAAFCAKFSRTQNLMEEKDAIEKKVEEQPKTSCRKRASAIWKNRSFKKKDVSIVDFIFGRKKSPTEKKKKACIIA